MELSANKGRAASGTPLISKASIDWSIKESVRARMKVLVKRLLRQYGYPLDKQVIATETVLQQAELFTEDWVKSTFESHPVRSLARRQEL
ncbi:MAG: DUF3387 domain-containing protein [Deltaproteobacteria bacterium]|nr:DUF3387 domain-containing protein [Deltaproteobacteria bacterium]